MPFHNGHNSRNQQQLLPLSWDETKEPTTKEAATERFRLIREYVNNADPETLLTVNSLTDLTSFHLVPSAYNTEVLDAKNDSYMNSWFINVHVNYKKLEFTLIFGVAQAWLGFADELFYRLPSTSAAPLQPGLKYIADTEEELAILFEQVAEAIYDPDFFQCLYTQRFEEPGTTDVCNRCVNQLSCCIKTNGYLVD